MAKLKIYDGSKWVIPDADTVDGKHASDFAAASHTHSNYAAASHSHSYLPLSGGTLSGILTSGKGISLPTVGSSWISGMTQTQLINFTGNSTGSYHPMIRYNMYAGHVANIGGLGNTFGFYGYKNGRTENGTDCYAYLDVANNRFSATKFYGPLEGNASTATKLATARTISLTGDVTGSASFDGSANISITATVADNSHNHSNYLPLTGGNITGSLSVTKKIQTNSFAVQKEYCDGEGYYNFNNGCLVTTNIHMSTNTMAELYITGNGYNAFRPVDIKINCYTYNGDIIQRSCLCNGYATEISTFFNSGGYLCFWLKQEANYHTFRFKLCTATGVSSPSYTVSNTAKPTTDITKLYVFDNIRSYTTSNVSEIVSRGENSNGTYVRYLDGTQICSKSILISTPVTSVWGSIYASGFFSLGSWAASFTNYPVISMSGSRANNHSYMVGGFYLDSPTSAGSVEIYRGTSAATVQLYVHINAIGRWK